MKRAQKKEIGNRYMDKIHNSGNAVKSIIDNVQCPCKDSKQKICDIYGYYPAHCQQVNDQINRLIK